MLCPVRATPCFSKAVGATSSESFLVFTVDKTEARGQLADQIVMSGDCISE